MGPEGAVPPPHISTFLFPERQGDGRRKSVADVIPRLQRAPAADTMAGIEEDSGALITTRPRVAVSRRVPSRSRQGCLSETRSDTDLCAVTLPTSGFDLTFLRETHRHRHGMLVCFVDVRGPPGRHSSVTSSALAVSLSVSASSTAWNAHRVLPAACPSGRTACSRRSAPPTAPSTQYPRGCPGLRGLTWAPLPRGAWSSARPLAWPSPRPARLGRRSVASYPYPCTPGRGSR